MLTWRLLDTGYCTAHESMLLRGARRVTIACHALVALIEHPQHGMIVWDTGYAPRMLNATERLPWRLYRRATPLHIAPELSLAAQLDRIGIAPESIGTLILSHLHADHVAGLRDLPSARIVLHRAALDEWRRRTGLRALGRAIVPALFPPDFAARAQPIDRFDGAALPGLGATHDLLGDGSILLVELPGHARGQIGAFLPSADRPVLLAADGAWHSRAIRERRPPHPLTYLFVDDRRAVQHTLAALHDFAVARPDVLIVPTHCPEIYAREIALA